MRKQLKFRPEIVASTRKTFKRIAKKMQVPIKKLTFVGVHNRSDIKYKYNLKRSVSSIISTVRMGDVDEFVPRLKMFDEPLDENYFADAMEYFREEYDPVAFLYVSNDMKWTRENIPNEKGMLCWKFDRIAS